MKRIKKLASVLLALVMMLALSVPAFAAGQNGEEYKAYKIFEASVLKDDNGDPVEDADGNQTVSYTINAKDAWYSAVKAYADKNGSGLTLTASAADANTYVVGTTASFSAADFAAELAKATTGKTASGTATANAETTTITVSGDGYYLITSSLGALTALVTDGSNSITIVEKNTVPSITKKVRIDEEEYADFTTADVIDTIDYQLTVNTGTNTNTENLGTGVDSNYTIKDVLPTGFAYDSTKGAVAISGWTVDTDYTVNWDATTRTLTIVLKKDKVATLAKGTDIVITYSATVTAADAELGHTIGNENTATLTYSKQTATDNAIVYTYEIGGLDDKNVPYFQKIDGTTQEALAGVTFVLSKTENGTTTYATVDNSGYLTGWSNSATELKTDGNGSINVKGLDAGTYILTETATVDGYNLLDDTITVTISEEGAVTYQLTSEVGDEDEETNPGDHIAVKNNKGSELPSTGGMGTTVLYVLGTALVLGAGVLLVVRRRMNADK